MKLSTLRRVIKAVELLMTVRDRLITSNQVATVLENAQSRATTYRYMEKARAMGLLECTTVANGMHHTITSKGYMFLEAWHELGI